MEIIICNSKTELGKKAASKGAEIINEAIKVRGMAIIIVATGASQFEMLQELVNEDIEWEKVTAFHLDEYIGMKENHPASFRKYLKERFVDKVAIKEFIYINGESNIEGECTRLNNLIDDFTIDLAFVGIGENAHLAFNDPPADFKIEDPYLVVNLDDDCRKQQFGEGWFPSLEDVPHQAISMSIKQILKSQHIICSIPDLRKSRAVMDTIESEISPLVPSSILKSHNSTWLYLDNESSSRLKIK